MYAPGYVEPALPMIHPLGPWGYQFGTIATTQFASSGAFEGANTAAYFPIHLPRPVVARRVFWANGSSVSASYNVSVAIYAATPDGQPGTKIVECAATAQGTAAQVQFVDITDTYVPAGVCWIALSCSSASATFQRLTLPEAQYDAAARFQQASITVGALPATATPSESASQSTYMFGFATTASP